MAHPLEDIIRSTDRFVLIGDSSADRFPALSYAAYVAAEKPFYCLDLGGLAVSRGPHKGGKVYHSVDELPDDRSNLAVIWLPPKGAVKGVELAHEAGCTRVWFSFKTGHRDAVARAEELGMEVVEIGRCPVYYLDKKTLACKAHTLVVKLSGTYKLPPQRDPNAPRKELR